MHFISALFSKKSLKSSQLFSNLSILKYSFFVTNRTELIREFSILPKEKYNRNNKDRLQKKEDLNLGLVFEPTQIYKILNCFDVLNVDDGRQQDAEEFLGCLLNSLNDEMNEVSTHFEFGVIRFSKSVFSVTNSILSKNNGGGGGIL